MEALLEEVSRHLSGRGVRHALIGAGALAVHGVSRSTFDLDLLVTDQAVLQAAFWAELAAAGAAVETHLGDHDDPLAGVVRLARAGTRSVDVVVGRHAWQGEQLSRARSLTVGAAAIPVVTPADLVLLKLFAGGPQDAWDVEQLLAVAGHPDLAANVEAMLPRLPAAATALWRRITAAR
ncbi:MAG: hypothetical protein IPO09_00060 [Anaeromyxobacter sp.]|nr:hypothetical protein [Anaeromyxobacter sp.]